MSSRVQPRGAAIIGGREGTPAFSAAPRGLFVNAFAIECPGGHRLHRVRRPDSHSERRELERRLGTSAWGSGDWLYLADGDEGDSIGVRCDHDADLHGFVLREALLDHARGCGFDAFLPFAGELRCFGLPGELRAHGVVGQRGLRLRVQTEPALGVPLLCARHATRWLLDGDLSDAEMRNLAVGQSAMRLDGDGPRRAEVLRASANEILLRTRGGEVSVAPGDYTLSAGSSLVRRSRGPAAFRWLQVSSGSLTSGGRRNRFAIRDRISALSEDLGAFGLEFALPDGGRARISPSPIEIRVQERR
jgi:hypothetical protein